MRNAVCVLLLLSAASCSTAPYEYRASVPAGADLIENETPPGATYAVRTNDSPDAPQGSLRVATLGAIDLESRDPRNEKNFPDIRVLHMQLVLDNSSGTSLWRLNTRDLKVSLPEEGESIPAYVNADADPIKLPNIEIPAGQRKVVDLYYPLPDDMEDAGDIPRFAFSWKLRVGNQEINETTPFERFEIQPYIARYPVGSWWNDPYYSLWSWDRTRMRYGFL